MNNKDLSLHPADVEEFTRQTETALLAMSNAGLPKEFIALLFRQALAGQAFGFLSSVHELSFYDPKEALAMSNETFYGPAGGISGLYYGFAAFKVAIVLNSAGVSKSNGARRYREADIEKKFYDNLSAYLSGARKVEAPKGVTTLKPDGFIKLNGALMPVEVKAERFGRSALGQLQEYMTVFKCSKGIAVAPKLGVALPENVMFVSVKPDKCNVVEFRPR